MSSRPGGILGWFRVWERFKPCVYDTIDVPHPLFWLPTTVLVSRNEHLLVAQPNLFPRSNELGPVPTRQLGVASRILFSRRRRLLMCVYDL